MVKGLGDLAKGGYELATDANARESAWETTKQLADAVADYGKSVTENPGEAYRHARDGTLAAYDRFEQAKDLAAAEGHSAEFFGDMAGGALFEVGSILVPVGLVAKAGKLGKVTSVADEVADAAKTAKKVENAEDVFGATQKAKAVSVNPVIKEFDDKVSPIQRCPVADADVGGKNATKSIEDIKSFGNKIPLSQTKGDEIISLPKGQRPAPSSYLSKEYMDAHETMFKDGAARIQPSAPSGKIGRTETWVLPKQTAQDAIAKADGDPRKLEGLLGLDKGYLGDNPVLVNIPKAEGYKIPSENEFAAYDDFWKPGGLTYPGGMPEAVIDSVMPGNYTIKPIF